MPYIKPDNRRYFDPFIEQLASQVGALSITDPKSKVGNANYIVTRLLVLLYGPDYRYADVNDAIGILECAKLEFYRKVAAPYEDVKESENGKVHDTSTPSAGPHDKLTPLKA